MPSHRYILVMTKELVNEFFKDVEERSPNLINGKVLLSLLKLAYFCGLKKQELIALRIKDVQMANGEILHEVTLEHGDIALKENVRTLLREHIQHLKMSGYQVSRNSPLFPRKLIKNPARGFKRVSDWRYNERTLQRDLRRLREKIPRINVLDTLRWAGIFHYYESLKSNNLPLDCIGEASRFARFDRNYFQRIVRYKWCRYYP